MARCDELAACSEETHRLTRRFLTEPMNDVHSLLSGWMHAAGLTSRVDNAGNLVGRLPSQGGNKTQRPTPTLLVGSHLDTVPGGGRYDGVLGVLMGLALTESLNQTPLPFHIDVVGFSEEEGVRFSKPYLGSSAIAGHFQSHWLERCDANNITLQQAIVDFGLTPSLISDAAYVPQNVIGFVEPHLEQGPVLESCGSPVGIVTAIAGQSRLRLNFTGEMGHAGTTPMQGRKDALVSAAEFIQTVNELSQQTDDLRATVGKLLVSPNATNVIPGAVELSLDVRHPIDKTREWAVDTMLGRGEEIARANGLQFTVLENTPEAAVTVDPRLTETLAKSVVDCGHSKTELPSGAGHDAVMMAKRFPTAMLFLRHPGGISHHPDERVDRDDVAVGIDVLNRFVRRLADS